MTVLSVLVVLLAVALAVVGGWPLTAWVLRRSMGGAPTAPDGAPTAPAPGADVLRGGSWIGLLERFAIVGSVLVGYPEAMAVVIAIKGLGRFPELRAATGAAASERFIIGTLTSFCWAAAVGVGARAVLSALG